MMNQITTLVAFKQANTQVPKCGGYPNEERKLYSHQDYPLSETGEKQVEVLTKELGQKFKFSHFISAPQRRSQDTMRSLHEVLGSQDCPVNIMDNWDEVRMEDLNGKSDQEIRNLFQKYNPNKTVPQDVNDMMNEQWPKIEGEPVINFEDFNSFAARISTVTEETFFKNPGKTIALSTNTEPLRNLIIDAVATPDFIITDFGKQILTKLEAKKNHNKIAEVDLFQKTLRELGLQRADIKPNDTAYGVFTVGEKGVLHLKYTTNFLIR